ncbi:MAG TPA: hypothetical protein VNT99_08925, partial [Methylomirabilota bacterium]|nr:hypothetical protein [Methylomirabilota bacterium]
LRPRTQSWASSPYSAQFDLTSPPNSQFLEATLQSITTNNILTCTGMVGTVYQDGFAGASPIGTFRARRLQ